MTARRFGSASTVRHPFARSTWLAGLQLRFSPISPADGDLTSMLQICQSCPEVPQRLRLRRVLFWFLLMSTAVSRGGEPGERPFLFRATRATRIAEPEAYSFSSWM